MRPCRTGCDFPSKVREAWEARLFHLQHPRHTAENPRLPGRDQVLPEVGEDEYRPHAHGRQQIGMDFFDDYLPGYRIDVRASCPSNGDFVFLCRTAIHWNPTSISTCTKIGVRIPVAGQFRQSRCYELRGKQAKRLQRKVLWGRSVELLPHRRGLRYVPLDVYAPSARRGTTISRRLELRRGDLRRHVRLIHHAAIPVRQDVNAFDLVRVHRRR
jgi:hypothetical protein